MDELLTRLISRDLKISERSVKSVLELLEDGCTVPFIARYRKEKTDSLNEVQISDIKDQSLKISDLQKRKVYILETIRQAGALSKAIEDRIASTWDSTVLEDIFLPYKPKRKTRATKARENGLEPLATEIMAQQQNDIVRSIGKYLKGEITTVEDAVSGAKDIIAEWISEDVNTRAQVRMSFDRAAVITSKVVKSKAIDAEKYKDYFDFSERLNKCPSHRLLAILRGEEEGYLKVNVQPDIDRLLDRLKRHYIKGDGKLSRWVEEAVEDSYKRLLGPSIETEFRKSAKEKADIEAINVFTSNLSQLLLAAPLGEKGVIAIDPGFRTGCKLVCLDKYGDLLYHTTIYPNAPMNRVQDSSETINKILSLHAIEAIAIGNGTAGRETFEFLRGVVADKNVPIYMVNEAGASIYSASEIAREEFPDLDLTVRGAISIGRRLMDPLAELVKIDPKSIGVGQYQHDVNQVQLKESLARTVSYCVNSVGINLNTASAPLLNHVSGLGPVLAHNIISYRQENGPFSSRQELMKVPRMGSKAFQQSAGFLRIRDGIHPLDNTAVHPERYDLIESMARNKRIKVSDLIADESIRSTIPLAEFIDEEVGMPTLLDIMSEIAKPGLDPRGTAEPIAFRSDIKSIEDLEVGITLPGVVTNLTNFGAFVDIGIKGDGLVHISQITDKFIKSPAEVLVLGQHISVRVIEIDIKRSRVNLSLKNLN